MNIPSLNPIMSLLAAGPGGGSMWFPEAASTEAHKTDSLFGFILALAVIFFVGIISAMIFFAIKYRQRDPAQPTADIHGNTRLEIAWAVIPAFLLIAIFAWGARDYMSAKVPPGNALEVRVTAQKWSWTFDYPKEGINTNELVVPVDRPVKLTMSSMDVIHSFFVPAFRIKQDVLPNRYTLLWFNPKEEGSFDVLCAEYCGTAHSSMLAKVVVKSEAEYQKWVDSGGGMDGKGMSSTDFGKMLFKSKGCATCHSVDGTKLTGPSMLGKFGSTETLTNGATVQVDDNYIRESIMKPNAKVVQGYQPVMPTFAGRLKEKQLNAVIDYIKSIGK